HDEHDARGAGARAVSGAPRRRRARGARSRRMEVVTPARTDRPPRRDRRPFDCCFVHRPRVPRRATRAAAVSADLADLARGCCALARTAGRAILAIYGSDFAVERKRDDSPLTAADLASHRAILDGLRVLTPQIPLLSEESAEQVPWSERRRWPRYWLVDPLD